MPIHDRLSSTPDVPAAAGFAHAVTASGRLAFLSGQVALDSSGELVGPGDLAAQTEQVIRNLHSVLRELGADWPDVVRFNWYLTDVADVQVVRDAKDKFIRPALGELPYPASSLIQVAALVRPEFLVELDAVAAIPE